jgi:hypothetical protein
VLRLDSGLGLGLGLGFMARIRVRLGFTCRLSVLGSMIPGLGFGMSA